MSMITERDCQEVQQITDSDLLELIHQNVNYFTCVVSRYQALLRRYVKRLTWFDESTIDEILQEVFIRVYRNLNAFDRSQKFSSWIYSITHHYVIDYHRKHKLSQDSSPIEDHYEIFDGKLSLEEVVVQNEDYKKIVKIINNLPDKYRHVAVLRFLEEKEYEEISDILKQPINTIATIVRRSKERIFKEYGSTKR